MSRKKILFKRFKPETSTKAKCYGTQVSLTPETFTYIYPFFKNVTRGQAHNINDYTPVNREFNNYIPQSIEFFKLIFKHPGLKNVVEEWNHGIDEYIDDNRKFNDYIQQPLKTYKPISEYPQLKNVTGRWFHNIDEYTSANKKFNNNITQQIELLFKHHGLNDIAEEWALSIDEYTNDNRNFKDCLPLTIESYKLISEHPQLKDVLEEWTHNVKKYTFIKGEINNFLLYKKPYLEIPLCRGFFDLNNKALEKKEFAFLTGHGRLFSRKNYPYLLTYNTQNEPDADDLKLPTPNDSNDLELPTPNDSNDLELPTQNDSNDLELPTQNDSDGLELPTQNDSDDLELPTQNDSDDLELPTQNDSDDLKLPTLNNLDYLKLPTPNNLDEEEPTATYFFHKGTIKKYPAPSDETYVTCETKKQDTTQRNYSLWPNHYPFISLIKNKPDITTITDNNPDVTTTIDNNPEITTTIDNNSEITTTIEKLTHTKFTKTPYQTDQGTLPEENTMHYKYVPLCETKQLYKINNCNSTPFSHDRTPSFVDTNIYDFFDADYLFTNIEDSLLMEYKTIRPENFVVGIGGQLPTKDRLLFQKWISPSFKKIYRLELKENDYNKFTREEKKEFFVYKQSKTCSKRGFPFERFKIIPQPKKSEISDLGNRYWHEDLKIDYIPHDNNRETFKEFFKHEVLANSNQDNLIVLYQPDEDEQTRIVRRSLGKTLPIRVLKHPNTELFFKDASVQKPDINILRFKFNERKTTTLNKPIKNTIHLVFKQKRYNRKKNIALNQKILDPKDPKNKYSGNPFLKEVNIIEENLGNPTKQYKLVKKAKLRSNVTKVANWNRLLRSRRVLVLPAHVNITVITNSFDIVHSWHIPGLGLKMDCLPGRATHHTIYIDNVGLYYGQCAEVCGRYHHHMPIRVCALPFEHFLVWWHTFGLPKSLFYKSEKKPLNLPVKKYLTRRFSW
jgi:heme/copper-type cytochrome/quinol oxidase subunit 2